MRPSSRKQTTVEIKYDDGITLVISHCKLGDTITVQMPTEYEGEAFIKVHSPHRLYKTVTAAQPKEEDETEQ